MSYLLGIIGLFVTLGLAFLISSNKKAIKLKPLIVMFVLQLVLGFVLLRTTFGTAVVSVLAKMFDHLLAFAGQGVDFVFAGVANKRKCTFLSFRIDANCIYFCYYRYSTLYQDSSIIYESCWSRIK